jgi:hemoglobin
MGSATNRFVTTTLRAASWALLAVLTTTVSAQQPRTLYQRLGGYDAITAVVGDFADRLFADQKLASFFGSMSTSTQTRFKQLNTLLVCNATGGPCTYLGRSMPESHAGIGIANADFDAVAAHLVATLDKFKVPAAEKAELLAIIGGLRPSIVGP